MPKWCIKPTRSKLCEMKRRTANNCSLGEMVLLQMKGINCVSFYKCSNMQGCNLFCFAT